MLCTKIVLNVKTKQKQQFMYTTCSELLVFMYWTGKSMNNLLSYFGLVDAIIGASDKDLPVKKLWKSKIMPYHLFFRSWLHWMLVNVKGFQTESGRILCKYTPPTPSANSGLHRYIFFLFKQEDHLDQVGNFFLALN